MAVFVGGFLLHARHHLERPGLHSDELLFATPALGAGGATYDPWFHLPLMVGGYLGALKAYLFMPVFAVVDPGPLVIRLPAWRWPPWPCSASGGSCAGAAGAGGRFSCWPSSCFDPSYTFAARVDWGPTVLMQVLKAAALLAGVPARGAAAPAGSGAGGRVAARPLRQAELHLGDERAGAGRTGRARPRLLEMARASRGGSGRRWPCDRRGHGGAVRGRDRLPPARSHPLQAGLSPCQRVGFTLCLVARTFDGSLIHDWVVLRPLGRWPVAAGARSPCCSRPRPWWPARAAGPGPPEHSAWRAGSRSAWWPRPRSWRSSGPRVPSGARTTCWCCGRSRRRPPRWRWRWRCAAAKGAPAAAPRPAGRRGRRGRAGGGGPGARGGGLRARHLRRRPHGNPLFSPEIYDLARFVDARLPAVASVVTADWGLRYPLRTLAGAGQREKIRDFWQVFREYGRGDGRFLYKEWFEGRRVIVVSYLPERRVFADSDANWRAFQEKHLRPGRRCAARRWAATRSCAWPPTARRACAPDP